MGKALFWNPRTVILGIALIIKNNKTLKYGAQYYCHYRLLLGGGRARLSPVLIGLRSACLVTLGHKWLRGLGIRDFLELLVSDLPPYGLASHFLAQASVEVRGFQGKSSGP